MLCLLAISRVICVTTDDESEAALSGLTQEGVKEWTSSSKNHGVATPTLQSGIAWVE